MLSSRMMRPIVAGLALAVLAGCKPLDDTMVMIFGRSMRDQPSFDPYENTRGVPEGSIAFSSGNYPAEPGQVNIGQPEGVYVPRLTQADLGTPGVGSVTAQAMVNPIDPADAEWQERGEEIYLRFCVVCHGPNGVGTQAYIADKHPVLAAYNLSSAQVAGYSDQYIYTMVRVGRGLMPEYGSRITEFDRWAVVNYVRELQRQAGTLPTGEDE